MLPRTLETEAMDTPAEAADYDSMDHAEVNRLFVTDLLAVAADLGDVLDLGTGTAQIPIELCRRAPSARVLAVDSAGHMVELARQNVKKAGLTDRIRLETVDAKHLPYPPGRFPTVMSNSIVHHIPRPEDVLEEAWRVAAPGGLLFFRDLFRPQDESTLRRLVDTYAAGASPHQRQMFADSLRAAVTVVEMRLLVARLGDGPQSVQATSDRHWTWVARKR
jgi:ubiquinone/menaquinone biosynthesis C-methylase UbiE